MEVAEARAFLVLAEELHFGRAADRLNMAQPPLSRTIRQLERRLKVQLFDRSTRRVELTAAGAALIEPAKRLVEASDSAVRTARDVASGATGVVRLGFASASVRGAVSGLVRAVSAKYPGVSLDLHSALLSAQGLEKVRTGEIDCMIGRWTSLPVEISATNLFREEIVAVVPESHPLAREHREAIRVADLAGEEWVVLRGGPGAALQSRVSVLARRAGFSPTVRSSAPDSWTQLVLVASGLGVALTLDSVRDNTNRSQLHYMRLLDDDRFIDVQLAWKKDNNNPAFANLLACAEELFPPGEN
ncbi:LysR family transcriptional regulator [Corynebacterium liangguodongii]|uniref:LysR family transcriptional regulator n=1 Tax=Corynebacterium liangguodongii TaxID=2079535 RepID=A0A2S0WF88_9CORY|nr:LysR substrate-binding domain-containing protein [Corynebacterium liangguodongii]AWB84447.1 LysR family transcriptional regulator [Corynebacterium liangguodongii]PWB99936.1 LysR family transcriptional regulator [Corynebacterium liangguodongii]